MVVPVLSNPLIVISHFLFSLLGGTLSLTAQSIGLKVSWRLGNSTHNKDRCFTLQRSFCLNRWKLLDYNFLKAVPFPFPFSMFRGPWCLKSWWAIWGLDLRLLEELENKAIGGRGVWKYSSTEKLVLQWMKLLNWVVVFMGPCTKFLQGVFA